MDHLNKSLREYAIYTIENRALPAATDGLKPSQRKILYTGLKIFKPGKNLKVSQFGPKVSELTEYHHGEASLFGAIINMAQDYVGSNNCNLFANVECIFINLFIVVFVLYGAVIHI